MSIGIDRHHARSRRPRSAHLSTTPSRRRRAGGRTAESGGDHHGRGPAADAEQGESDHEVGVVVPELVGDHPRVGDLQEESGELTRKMAARASLREMPPVLRSPPSGPPGSSYAWRNPSSRPPRACPDRRQGRPGSTPCRSGLPLVRRSGCGTAVAGCSWQRSRGRCSDRGIRDGGAVGPQRPRRRCARRSVPASKPGSGISMLPRWAATRSTTCASTSTQETGPGAVQVPVVGLVERDHRAPRRPQRLDVVGGVLDVGLRLHLGLVAHEAEVPIGDPLLVEPRHGVGRPPLACDQFSTSRWVMMRIHTPASDSLHRASERPRPVAWWRTARPPPRPGGGGRGTTPGPTPTLGSPRSTSGGSSPRRCPRWRARAASERRGVVGAHAVEVDAQHELGRLGGCTSSRPGSDIGAQPVPRRRRASAARTSKLASAACSQVSSAARSSAPRSRRRSESVVREHGHQRVGQLVVGVGQQSGTVPGNRVRMAGDVGGDRRRSARCRLGEGHAPPLAHRRRGGHPGAPVEVEQLRVGDATRQFDGAVDPEATDLRLDERIARSPRRR